MFLSIGWGKKNIASKMILRQIEHNPSQTSQPIKLIKSVIELTLER